MAKCTEGSSWCNFLELETRGLHLRRLFSAKRAPEGMSRRRPLRAACRAVADHDDRRFRHSLTAREVLVQGASLWLNQSCPRFVAACGATVDAQAVVGEIRPVREDVAYIAPPGERRCAEL